MKSSKKIEEVSAQIDQINTDLKRKMDELQTLLDDNKRAIEVKNTPIYLEKDIHRIMLESIDKTISAALTGYNSPLIKLTEAVVNKHQDKFKNIIEESILCVIEQGQFKAGVKAALANKIAKTILSNNDGVIDKCYNDLRQNAEFRSKATLAIANIVKEFQHDRSSEA